MKLTSLVLIGSSQISRLFQIIIPVAILVRTGVEEGNTESITLLP